MGRLLKNRYGFFRREFRNPVITNIAFTKEVPFLVLPSKGLDYDNLGRTHAPGFGSVT